MRKLLITFIAMLPLMANAHDFKLLSWNVFMIPKPINFTKQSERTKLIAKQLHEVPHDILLFQEAFSKSFKKKIGRELKEKYPYQAKLNKSVRLLHFLNSGLFIASKHPFEILGHYYFTKSNHTDAFASKGVLLIEVTLPNEKKVQIATTHVQAWDDQKAVRIRAFQFGEIRKFLDKYKKPGIPQILAGDLNIDSLQGEEYTSSLSILALEDGPLDGELYYSSGYKIPCYHKPGDSKGPFRLLDHILVDRNDSDIEVLSRRVFEFKDVMKRGIECALSDHQAIEAHIQL